MKQLAKKIFDIGKRKTKKLLKSIYYFTNIFKNLKYFTKELAQFLKPRNEEELSRGAILIEFAVCMPVLIILLFYINDLMRIKRYYSQTEFVAQQMANIIQNISQKRTDKRITLTDLNHAAALAWLTVYAGDTLKKGYSAGAPVNASPWIFIYYVKGTSGNKATNVWGIRISCRNHAPAWDKVQSSGNDSHSGLKWGTNVDPSYIHPSLKINEGEYKLIIENSFNWNSAFAYDEKKAFNLRLINPKGNTRYILFPSVVIFTPKPGLFTKTAP